MSLAPDGLVELLTLLAIMRKVPGVCAQVVHNFVCGLYILRTICAQTAGTLRMVCTQLLCAKKITVAERVRICCKA